MARLAHALLLSLGLLALGCGSTATAPSTDGLSIRRSWTGLHATDGERSCELVRDEAAWSRAWRRAGNADADLPAVDFARERIVAVFHGDARAQLAMEAALARDGDEWVLAYDLFSTSGELPPQVRPWGFYEVGADAIPLRVESHHVTGPSPADVDVRGRFDEAR